MSERHDMSAGQKFGSNYNGNIGNILKIINKPAVISPFDFHTNIDFFIREKPKTGSEKKTQRAFFCFQKVFGTNDTLVVNSH